jgi:hypothetical protein
MYIYIYRLAEWWMTTEKLPVTIEWWWMFDLTSINMWKFNDLVCVLTILLFILLINRIADVIVSANASDAEHMGFDNLNG